MSRNPMKSRLLHGISLAALGAGLSACATGDLKPVASTEVGAYYASHAYTLYYQGPAKSPALMVLDTAGGLEMRRAGWDKAGPAEAKAMLARALKGGGAFQTMNYTDANGKKRSEAVLYVDGVKGEASYDFKPDPKAGTFTLSETASFVDGGGGGGGY